MRRNATAHLRRLRAPRWYTIDTQSIGERGGLSIEDGLNVRNVYG